MPVRPPSLAACPRLHTLCGPSAHASCTPWLGLHAPRCRPCGAARPLVCGVPPSFVRCISCCMPALVRLSYSCKPYAPTCAKTSALPRLCQLMHALGLQTSQCPLCAPRPPLGTVRLLVRCTALHAHAPRAPSALSYALRPVMCQGTTSFALFPHPFPCTLHAFSRATLRAQATCMPRRPRAPKRVLSGPKHLCSALQHACCTVLHAHAHASYWAPHASLCAVRPHVRP